MRMIRWLLVTCAMALAGCATQPTLDGAWSYQTPAGQTFRLLLSALENGRVYISGDKVLLTGVYQRTEGTLVMEKPDNPRAEGFKLKIMGADEMRVVSEPSVAITGQKHISGILRRI